MKTLVSLTSLTLGIVLVAGLIQHKDAAKERSLITKYPLVVLEEQGWTHEDAEWFYHTTQGSRITRLDWLKHLKTTNDVLFLDTIPSYGYIARKKTDRNPDGLPVGFVPDKAEDRKLHGDWVGMTCAACHTSTIDYKEKTYLIDGGPGFGDPERLLESLAKSLQSTLKDPKKFRAFANALGKTSDSEKEALRKDLEIQAEQRASYNRRNFHSDKDLGGFGRLDAFGSILNEVTVRFLNTPENHKIANAPVSYPYLWDTPHHDRVQWNGAAKNKGLGDLGRNVGEVLGVFADLNIVDPGDPKSNKVFRSSVRIHKLRALEEKVKKLKSPLWPEAFGTIDKSSPLFTRGRDLFMKTCVECHDGDTNRMYTAGEYFEFDRDNPKRKIEAELLFSDTDPLMSDNFNSRRVPTGILKGDVKNFKFFGLPHRWERFGDEASGAEILGHVVVGTIINSWREAPTDTLEEAKKNGLIDKSAELPQYKSRPLNGIWATAPYLHNGSVPTMRDLLKPAKERPKTFYTGSHDYNPDDMGFETEYNEETGNTFLIDTSIKGNWKTGHEYGTGISKAEGGDGIELTDSDINALLYYLKSL